MITGNTVSGESCQTNALAISALHQFKTVKGYKNKCRNLFEVLESRNPGRSVMVVFQSYERPSTTMKVVYFGDEEDEKELII